MAPFDSEIASRPTAPTQTIGTVKGPGETGNQYVFITQDHQQVKIGEFVYYLIPDPGNRRADRQVLGKISGLKLIEHLPDRIFADSETSPETIAALIGFTYDHPELYEITVDVVGYFDLGLGFLNLRRSPQPGAKVFLADDAMLQRIINRRAPETIGSAHVGSLLLRDPGAVRVILDVKELVSTHMAILAGTGSGKSYTAGVLIEELLRPYNRAAVLIFDPHGEYSTLEELRGHADFREGDYAPRVQILTPDQIRIRLSSLDYYDLVTLLPALSDRQQAILSKAFGSLRKHKGGSHRWDVRDLIAAVHQADTATDDEGNETKGSSAGAIEWKLEQLDRSPYFDPQQHLTPPQLIAPGQVTVLQMNEISQPEQQVICAALLRQIYNARLATHKEAIGPDDENYLPYPAFILLEEAHRYAPAHEPARCKQILRTILGEGRKFGLGIGLITQRPGKIDSDVLSQCMSQFLMRIVNPVDQESLRHGVEAAGRDLLSELPALTKGQVIIAGACVNTPVLCQIRSRLTTHGGTTMDAPALWANYFQTHHQEERRIEKAPIAPRKQSKTHRGVSIE
jgi:uncharacterized protein